METKTELPSPPAPKNTGLTGEEHAVPPSETGLGSSFNDPLIAAGIAWIGAVSGAV